VLKNPAISYSHGAGPIAIKTLIDDGVEMVIADELGIGASEILENHNIKYVSAKPGTNVEKAVNKAVHR
jgi:predicted Fe-Mo cluster-binding NifX family protein